MKRFLLVTLAILTLAYVSVRADDPSEAEAEQLTGSCGEIKNRNSSSQFGRFLWLEYIVETVRPVNSFECPWLSVSVEAYVVGVEQSGASNSDHFTASVRRQIPVPHDGEWQTNGKHFRNYIGMFSFNSGETSSKATVTYQGGVDPPPDDGDSESPCDSDEACEEHGTGSETPIIIDVDRDGYRLTSLDDGVFFDLDADGVPELVSWTRAGSDDAFLAMDRNGNGRIDNGSELFGNNTPVYSTGPRITAANGFEVLKFLEGPGYGNSERNGVIDANDAAFAQLVVWTDANHNGISESEELRRLSAIGLDAIDTEYKLSRKRDRFGNEFRQRARATWQRGQTFIFDVWLLTRRP